MIAIVIKLLDIEKDDAKLVINKGSKDGITKKIHLWFMKMGMSYLIQKVKKV